MPKLTCRLIVADHRPIDYDLLLQDARPFDERSGAPPPWGRREGPQSLEGWRKPPHIPNAAARILTYPCCRKRQRPAQGGDRRARRRGWESKLSLPSARQPRRFAERALC